MSQKFEKRRAEILSAAIEHLNRHGLKGLNLSEIACAVGMSKANLTYYYRRRDDLAEACFGQTISDFMQMISDARSAGSDPQSRLSGFIAAYFRRIAGAVGGKEMPLAVLGDIRSLEEPHSSRIIRQFSDMLVGVAGLLDPVDGRAPDIYLTAPLAEITLIELFWAEAWLNQYPTRSYNRVAERFSDILWLGLAGDRAVWMEDWAKEACATAACAGRDDELGEFFRSAIRTINLHGYRGASLDRIAGALDATKGAIYNRFETKDELVAACFAHSFAAMWSIIEACEAKSGSAWESLVRIVAAFASFQTSANGPFLRETALTSLPGTTRLDVFRKLRQVQVHFASLVADAIAEGMARPVDPMLSSQMILAAMNGVDEINRFTPEGIVFEPVEVCARPVLFGMREVLERD